MSTGAADLTAISSVQGSGGEYAATKATNARPAPKTTVRHEDEILNERGRRAIMSTNRDMERNFSLAAWAIRKHLDFVSTQYFVSNNADDGFNRELERFIEWASQPEQFDARGRCSRDEGVRLIEQGRLLDGDIWPMRMRTGHVQLVEGDRVRTPPADRIFPDEIWYNGVLLDRFGRIVRVAVAKRLPGGRYEHERMIRAENIDQVGYFNRVDQVRGISPLAAGLNTFRDCYDNIGYALAKAKVAQMFGLKLIRGGNDQLGWQEDGGDGSDALGRYAVDPGRGPIVLDMYPGDDAQFLENKTPSGEFQSFMQSTIGIAIKAIDLPYNFFDESHTNFFGSKATYILYQKACAVKQRQLRRWLSKWVRWRLSIAVVDGDFSLPAGMVVDDVRFDWQAEGTPWWDPGAEIDADIAAINAGMKTLDEVVRSRAGPGEQGNWRAKIDQRAIEIEYARSKGVPLPAYGGGGVQGDPMKPEQTNEPETDDEEDD